MWVAEPSRRGILRQLWCAATCGESRQALDVDDRSIRSCRAEAAGAADASHAGRPTAFVTVSVFATTIGEHLFIRAKHPKPAFLATDCVRPTAWSAFHGSPSPASKSRPRATRSVSGQLPISPASLCAARPPTQSGTIHAAWPTTPAVPIQPARTTRFR